MDGKDIFDEIADLKRKIESSATPSNLREKLLIRLDRIGKLSGQPAYFTEIDRMTNYIEFLIALPWEKRSEDVLDLQKARVILDKNHYGLDQIKERVLEYLAVLRLKKEKMGDEKLVRAPILCFVGLVGTGKTTIAYSIAEAMGRKFARIPFGGMGEATTLRGHSRVYPEAEPGQILKALIRCGTKNPVILLDEIDRVTEQGRASIMGVLVELLDPEQNSTFTDYYLDYPFDLSEVLFIATANNTTNISPAVLDRLEPISMPAYSDEEKIKIGRDFVLPRTIKDAGLPEGSVVIDDMVWPQIVRPLGYDAGIRTLERTINGIIGKIAKQIVEGKGEKFVLTVENIKEFLPN